MNDRIQYLSDIAYQNHLKNNPHSSFGRRADYDKEFAELIIKECINSVMDGTMCGDDYAMRIQNHFGVNP
jgi:hypothetical protein